MRFFVVLLLLIQACATWQTLPVRNDYFECHVTIAQAAKNLVIAGWPIRAQSEDYVQTDWNGLVRLSVIKVDDGVRFAVRNTRQPDVDQHEFYSRGDNDRAYWNGVRTAVCGNAPSYF